MSGRGGGQQTDADAIGQGFRSILEALDEARPAGGLGFTRICELHTEFTSHQIQKMLRYLEAEFFIIKAKGEESTEFHYWTSSDGTVLLRKSTETAWWRFAKVYLGI